MTDRHARRAERARRRARRKERRADRERGFVIMWLVIVLVVLLAISAFAVDLVHAYAEGQHLQNAVDAAALAGAVEIPTDLNGTNASTRASQLLQQNGFGGAGDTVVQNSKDATIPNQMDVEVKHSFDTFFARIIGIPSLTVRRKAAAQYDAPIAMGSPSNNLGDVPAGSCAVFGLPPVPGNPAPCVTVPGNENQQLLAQIQGQATFKSSGNAFSTLYCSATPTDGCNGSTNSEADVNGEYVSIQDDDTTKPLYVFVYDPEYIDTGFATTAQPWNCSRTFTNTPLTYGPSTTSTYCTGDQRQAGSGFPSGNGAAFNIQYQILKPDGTPTPTDNVAYAGCTPLAIGGDDTGGANPGTLSATDLLYFQKWVQVCKVPSGDVAASGVNQEWLLHIVSPDSTGTGTNQFSVLALHTPLPPDPGPVTPPAQGLQVFTRQRLPLFATKAPVAGVTPPADFCVARVLPSTRDRVLTLNFFDLGDSPGGFSSDGTLQVITSPDVSGLGSCTYLQPPGTPPDGGSSDPSPPWGGPPDLHSGCTLSYDKSTWNAQWATVNVAVPSSYSCDTTRTDGCWVKLEIAPATDGSTLSDATTWSATMGGSPVRLVG